MPVPDTVFRDGAMAVAEYDALRGDIRDGDLLLCSGTAPFSRLIQRATGSIWSHVGFVMWLPTNPPRLMVQESVESVGVRSVRVSSYIRNYNGRGTGYPGNLLIARHDDFAAVQLTRDFIQFAVDRCGWLYGTEEMIEIAAAIASGGVLGQDNAAGHQRTYICSQYVDECYRRLGIAVTRARPGFIVPADFAADPKVNAVALLDSGWRP